MNENLLFLIKNLLGNKRFEILEFLAKKRDEFGFVSVKIEEIAKELEISKPTIIATFKALEEKKLIKRLKNGFYELKGEKNDKP